MSRARLPRRVKHTQRSGRSPAQRRHWRLVRRYYIRLSNAVKRVEGLAASFQARHRLAYRLEGHTPVWEPHTLVWAAWMEHASTNDLRQVAFDTVGSYRVSTVFLGTNYQWGDGPPIVFETMVFDHAEPPGPSHHDTYRYHTWAEAVMGHAEVVAQLRGHLVDPPKEQTQ